MTTRLAALAAVAAATLALAAAPASAALPPVHHVWVIVLENKGFDETFGPSSPAKFLSRELPREGQLLTQYYAIGHASLDNYIAMISGQAPNVETQADCQFYDDMLPGAPGPDGQAIGQGCVYPSQFKTLADQLAAKGLTWKGYMQDMGTPCRHPALNSRDTTQNAHVGDQYAARHNPFVYFHSIIDTPACAANDVDFSQLATDLQSPATSPAFADNGLLIVTFDEAESGDASACCNEQPGFNTTNPGGLTPGPGGGRTGAVLVSPFIRHNTVNATPYNHYSLLRSMEDLFGLAHLGYAGQDGLKPFGSDVFAGF